MAGWLGTHDLGSAADLGSDHSMADRPCGSRRVPLLSDSQFAHPLEGANRSDSLACGESFGTVSEHTA